MRKKTKRPQRPGPNPVQTNSFWGHSGRSWQPHTPFKRSLMGVALQNWCVREYSFTGVRGGNRLNKKPCVCVPAWHNRLSFLVEKVDLGV